MGHSRTGRGMRGFTLLDIVVSVSLMTIVAGVALPEFDSRRAHILTAQRLVMASLRTARTNAITKSQHFSVSFPTANQIQIAAMRQSPAGSGNWQVDTANVQTIALPSATQIAPSSVAASVEFTSIGMAPHLTGPLQVDAQDTFGVTKSLQIWPSGQVNEL